jgi:alkylated DNA repair dioxygenase AlkB
MKQLTGVFQDEQIIDLPDATLRYFSDFFSPMQSKDILTQLLDAKIIDWQQKNIKLFGKSVPQPRLCAWYGDEAAVYTYSGLVNYPLPWHDSLLPLKAKVESVAQTRFNALLLNCYRNGLDSMGWHSDNEPELGNNPIIASLSFGQTREFLLKHRFDKTLPIYRLSLTDGSLLLMSGTTQHFWKHCIPKIQNGATTACRVNLTFRKIIY